MDSRAAPFVGGGKSRMARRPAITARKLAPFTKKHHPSPSTLMAKPAMAGPMKLAPVTIVVLSATALARFSRPTISGTNAWRVGLSTAFTAPRRTANTRTCATPT